MSKWKLFCFVFTGIVAGLITYLVTTPAVNSLEKEFIKRKVTAAQRYDTETYWQDIIQKEIGGEKEYRLDDGTRVDLLFEDKACEIDWANKWAEGIGQSIYYGLKTDRPPLVILLAKKDGWEKYRDRVEYCKIECWVYDTRIEGWVDRD